ncbi:MAG: cell envelope integrity EipB family protein [Rhizobiaceae bacterium]|nr:cell envelope integrity EipB family protein [Rhizobiaceae bacterium]
MTKPLFNKKLLSTLYLCAPIIILAPDFTAASGFGTPVPHRAVYDVTLNAAEDRSGIKGMNGRIVYEVSGNECDGISVQYRFVTNVITSKNQFLTDQQTSTYESPDGKEFSFQTKSFVNEVADANVRGNARNLEDGIKVSISSPKKRELDLAKGMFVSTHLVQVIEEAKAGRHFFQKDIFDGSGKGDEVMASTSVIGNAKSFPKPLKGEKAEAVSKFDGQTAWPVTISYFKHSTDNSGESLPMYEAAFLLYESGISRKLVMTYPDYSLRADLQELEILDKGVCK